MSHQPDRPVSHDELLKVVARLRSFPAQWWIAGGWAIDLFLGRVTRSHSDLEIGLWRDDQAKVRAIFPERRWFKVVEKSWQPWDAGEHLVLPVFQLKALDESTGEEVEFFLNDRDEQGNFICRRDERIRMPIAEAIVLASGDISVIAPAMQLLYKAKYVREKDQHDFDLIVPLLSNAQRQWLRSSIELLHPNHAWLVRLTTSI
jgi:hypothetical protein